MNIAHTNQNHTKVKPISIARKKNFSNTSITDNSTGISLKTAQTIKSAKISSKPFIKTTFTSNYQTTNNKLKKYISEMNSIEKTDPKRYKEILSNLTQYLEEIQSHSKQKDCLNTNDKRIFTHLTLELEDTVNEFLKKAYSSVNEEGKKVIENHFMTRLNQNNVFLCNKAKEFFQQADNLKDNTWKEFDTNKTTLQSLLESDNTNVSEIKNLYHKLLINELNILIQEASNPSKYSTRALVMNRIDPSEKDTLKQKALTGLIPQLHFINRMNTSVSNDIPNKLVGLAKNIQDNANFKPFADAILYEYAYNPKSIFKINDSEKIKENNNSKLNLDSTSDPLKAQIIMNLAQLDNVDTTPYIDNFIKNNNSILQRTAIWLAGESKQPKQFITVLESILNRRSSNHTTKTFTARALEKINNKGYKVSKHTMSKCFEVLNKQKTDQMNSDSEYTLKQFNLSPKESKQYIESRDKFLKNINKPLSNSEINFLDKVLLPFRDIFYLAVKDGLTLQLTKDIPVSRYNPSMIGKSLNEGIFEDIFEGQNQNNKMNIMQTSFDYPLEGNSFFAHEWAHTIENYLSTPYKGSLLASICDKFHTDDSKLQNLYNSALKRDSFITDYANSTKNEYLAEGIRAYMNDDIIPKNPLVPEVNKNSLVKTDSRLLNFINYLISKHSQKDKSLASNKIF